jgi:alcohol dehydrogenase (NADP+)
MAWNELANPEQLQVLIRWGLQRSTSVLPKSTSVKRIASNLDVFDWQLSDADFNALSSLAYQRRMVDGAFLLRKQGPYRTLADIWDDDDSRLTAERTDLHTR